MNEAEAAHEYDAQRRESEGLSDEECFDYGQQEALGRDHALPRVVAGLFPELVDAAVVNTRWSASSTASAESDLDAGFLAVLLVALFVIGVSSLALVVQIQRGTLWIYFHRHATLHAKIGVWRL